MTHKDMGLHQLGDAPGRSRAKYSRYQTATYWKMKEYQTRKYMEKHGMKSRDINPRLAAILHLRRKSKKKITLPIVNLPE